VIQLQLFELLFVFVSLPNSDTPYSIAEKALRIDTMPVAKEGR
jgi:hypothetical protein